MLTNKKETYEPFGDEWKAELMKMRKADIIEFYKKALTEPQLSQADRVRGAATDQSPWIEEAKARLVGITKDQFLNSWSKEISIESSLSLIEAKKFLHSFYDKVVGLEKRLTEPQDMKQCMYCEKEVEYSSGVFTCEECSDKPEPQVSDEEKEDREEARKFIDSQISKMRKGNKTFNMNDWNKRQSHHPKVEPQMSEGKIWKVGMDYFYKRIEKMFTDSPTFGPTKVELVDAWHKSFDLMEPQVSEYPFKCDKCGFEFTSDDLGHTYSTCTQDSPQRTSGICGGAIELNYPKLESEKNKIVREFSDRLLTGQTNIPSDIVEIVNEEFWNMLGESTHPPKPMVGKELDAVYETMKREQTDNPTLPGRESISEERIFTETEIGHLQSEIHNITGDGEVMKLFNKLLGINAEK